MWTQWWVVSASSQSDAESRVQEALTQWTPAEQAPASLGGSRFYRGVDDLAIGEAVTNGLTQIRQVVSQSNRQELAQRLRTLSQRPIGIPPMEGWVVLDGATPRSPRPVDCRANGIRWVVTVQWPGTVPPQESLS